MTKQEKLLKRFLSKPNNFSFPEIKRLLNSFGYSEIKTGKTSGSRVAFYSEDRRHLIRLHKPHPQNRVKRYILDYLEDELRNAGVL
jgi:hypothetical protein